MSISDKLTCLVYKYQSLSGQGRPFRLLKVARGKSPLQLQCELIHVDLDTTYPPYECVSYTWGVPDRTEQLLLAGNRYVPITKALKEAMPYLVMKCRTGYLWIDQICIHQDDITERNKQVLCMGAIYSSCQACLVWLGNDDEHTVTVATLAGETQPNFGLEVSELNRRFDDVLISLEALLSRPWFKRAWVFQEIVLPPQSICIAGRNSMPLRRLCEVLRQVMLMKEETAQRNTFAGLQIIFDGYYRLQLMQDTAHAIRSHAFDNEKFCQILIGLQGKTESSNPRDLLYSLLGLLKYEMITGLQPDYSLPAWVVFARATKAFIASTCSLQLFSIFWYYHPPECEGVETPSWTLALPQLPDGSRYLPTDKYRHRNFTKDFFGNRTSWSDNFYCAADRYRKHVFSEDDNPEELSVQGKVVATIFHVSQYRSRFVDDTNAVTLCDEYRLDEIFEELQAVRRTSALQVPEGAPISRARLLSVLVQRETPAEQWAYEERLTRLLETYDKYKHLTYTELPELNYKPVKDFGERMFLNASNDDRHSRIVFVTSSFTLGLAPLSTQSGDSVCILHGCRLPVILRTNSDGRYTYVGTCYLEGVMSGEKTNWAEEDADEFVLV